MLRRFVDDGVEWIVMHVKPSLDVVKPTRDGWLGFRSDAELRRVYDWCGDLDDMTDSELSALLESARSFGAPRRLAE